MARDGKQASLVSIDAQLAQELTYSERIMWKKRLYETGVPTTFDHEIVRVKRRGNRIVATFRNLATRALTEHEADQIVVEHGTVPVDHLYQELRAASVNDGVTDLESLLALKPQLSSAPRGSSLELHRIGDAVASRNVHAAVLDAFRLCVAI